MKLKDRLGLGLAVILILSTILLVVDLQLDLGLSGAHLYDRGSKNGINMRVLNAVRIFQKDDVTGDMSSTEEFWLQNSKREPSIYSSVAKADKFNDLMAIVATADNSRSATVSAVAIKSSTESTNPTLGELLNMKLNKKATNLEKFHFKISKHEMYSESNAAIIEGLLRDMARLKIRHVTQKEGGTQLKLTIKYDKNIQALFKPMRYSRHKQTLPNHYYFSDFERHTAEIAAFHLDRVCRI